MLYMQAAVNAATASALRRAHAPAAQAQAPKDPGASRTADCMHVLCAWRDQRARMLDEGSATLCVPRPTWAHLRGP